MSNDRITGLNIRAKPSGSSVKLGILPRGSRVEIDERSQDGKWGKIKKILEGAVAPVLKGGETNQVDAEAEGWVFLGQLTPEGREPEAFDEIVFPSKPIPIRAGDVVGHVGEYQHWHDAGPTIKRGWRPLLHLEVFSGDKVPEFVGRSRSYAETLAASSRSMLVVEKGVRLVAPSEPNITLSPGEQVRMTMDSPKRGRWAKVCRVTLKVQAKNELGSYDSQTNTYATGATWNGWYVGTSDNQRTRSKEKAARLGYGRREVWVPNGQALWVERSAWREGAQQEPLHMSLPAWDGYPLKVKNVRAPEGGFTRVISKTELESLPAEMQETDEYGHRWWHVAVRTSDGEGRIASGWVCEKDHSKVSWQSPWAWPGFEWIEERGTKPLDFRAGLLHVLGRARPEETNDFKARADKLDNSALVKKLYEHIDRNHDSTLDAQELRAAMKQPLLAQSLSRIIAWYESEWGGGMVKWNELDVLMLEGKQEWAAEKERISKLQWWSKVAAKVEGFPSSPEAFHFHPVGLIANFVGVQEGLSLEEARVRAFLRMIRVGEGTVSDKGYRTLYGGSTFESFADHPRKAITAGKWTSTAAGAYQFLSKTWDGLAKRNSYLDFGPENQDRAAVELLRSRDCLEYIKRGETELAIRGHSKKTGSNKEWASQPESPYGQPVMTMAEALAAYEKYLDEELKKITSLKVPYGQLHI